MSATPSPRTYGRAYAWSLVIGFTAASVILNGAHAVLGMVSKSGLEQGLAAVVAVVAPLSLLLATHLVVGLIRDWSRRRRWVTRLRALCAATTVGIGGVAFATSFVALMDMAEMMGVAAGLTWSLPAVVDAMIVIATLAVVVAEAEIALDQAEAVEAERRAAEAEAARLAEEQAAAQAVARAELEAQRAAEVAPVVSVSEVVTDQGDRAADHVTDQTADHAVTSAALMVTDQADQSTDHGPLVVTDQETDHGDHPGTTAPEVVSDHADQAVTSERPEVLTEGWTAALGEDADGLSELGAMVRAELGTETAAEDISRALEMVQAGTSRRAVAEAVGVGSHNTIRRWVDTASRLDAGYAAAVG